jgi:phospho-N-acetylmuramoyl-pentapeptide-transferase
MEYHDTKSTKTTVPFIKNNEFDYGDIFPWLDKNYTWIVFTLVVIVIITAVSMVQTLQMELMAWQQEHLPLLD